ncbi:MAG: hypothetical protein V1870_05665 [Candidatus Aenigmatarchaeota archaeon]
MGDYKSEVEFPGYCRLDGRLMAHIKIGAMDGHRKSRNGCVGCADFECFGNNGYEKALELHQEEQIKEWKKYIIGRIDEEKDPKNFECDLI